MTKDQFANKACGCPASCWCTHSFKPTPKPTKWQLRVKNLKRTYKLFRYHVSEFVNGR